MEAWATKMSGDSDADLDRRMDERRVDVDGVAVRPSAPAVPDHAHAPKIANAGPDGALGEAEADRHLLDKARWTQRDVEGDATKRSEYRPLDMAWVTRGIVGGSSGVFGSECHLSNPGDGYRQLRPTQEAGLSRNKTPPRRTGVLRRRRACE